jgi:hypothetical protein
MHMGMSVPACTTCLSCVTAGRASRGTFSGCLRQGMASMCTQGCGALPPRRWLRPLLWPPRCWLARARRALTLSSSLCHTQPVCPAIKQTQCVFLHAEQAASMHVCVCDFACPPRHERLHNKKSKQENTEEVGVRHECYVAGLVPRKYIKNGKD